ncbi:MAG TPA: hypothetical protein VFS94_02520 [Gemmatimonadales bacterium]|nr:hypothetical protein [Gemmatimonadales bacterium]
MRRAQEYKAVHPLGEALGEGEGDHATVGGADDGVEALYALAVQFRCEGVGLIDGGGWAFGIHGPVETDDMVAFGVDGEAGPDLGGPPCGATSGRGDAA